MTLVLSYLRLMLFSVGLLVGVQVPLFVDEYGKSLEAQYLESKRNLGAFEDEARKYFEGSLAELIAHYRRSDDAVFVEGGDSIGELVDRHQLLALHLARYRNGPWQAYLETFVTAVPDVRADVGRRFSYAIKLEPTAIAFGLFCGFILSLTGEGLLRALRAVLRPTRRAT